MSLLPYVGVTGFARREDLPRIEEAARAVPAGYRLMAGILWSGAGENRPNLRYPRTLDLARELLVVAESAGAFPVVHFNTRAKGEDLRRELFELRTALPFRGVQLNLVAPDPAVVREFESSNPSLEIIVQVNGSSLRNDRSPLGVLRYLSGYEKRGPEGYEPVGGSVLLDLSGGTGREIDLEWIEETVQRLAESPVPRRIGIAGGFGPESLPTFRTLRERLGVERFRSLSVDAESRLRVPSPSATVGVFGGDDLDREKMLAYLDAFREAAEGR